MAEPKMRSTRRRCSSDDIPDLTPMEKTIAKYLRCQCPTKKGMFMGTQVVYFNGSKAVECLIESKWSSIRTQPTDDDRNPIYFSSKHDAVLMLRKFLDHDMFRRVVKVYKDQTHASESPIDENSPTNTSRQRKNKPNEGLVSSVETNPNDDSKDKTPKKKFKFELHDEQIFLDSNNDFYVWIYSPTTMKQCLIGGLLVIGSIGICLFPLWPTQIRTGVYYLSVIIASLLGGLLSLAVVRYILFAIIWLMTMGKIQFWLLPNLTEDVGFIESFIPLYMMKKTMNVEKKNEDDEKQSVNVNTEMPDEESKQPKLIVEGYEVLSKDELETK